MHLLESLDELVQVVRVQWVSQVYQVAEPDQICLKNTGAMKTLTLLKVTQTRLKKKKKKKRKSNKK